MKRSWGGEPAHPFGEKTDMVATDASKQPCSASTDVTPVIQRQVVLSKIDIIPSDGGEPPIVGDVIIGGRAPSPFSSTMGAHSTAWVAHIDAVRRNLVNLVLPVGVDFMLSLAKDELEKSPLLPLEGMLDAEHKEKLRFAKNCLRLQIQNMQDTLKKGEPQPIIQTLRSLINSYLTLVNYLPMSTVKGGDPRGHGEGSARGDLNLFEYVQAEVMRSKSLPKEFIDELGNKGFQLMVKQGAKKKFEDTKNLKQELIKRLWNMFAIETPDVFAQEFTLEDKLLVWDCALRNFLKTIRAAYPYSYDFTQMHDVDNQIAGLTNAMENANYSIEPGIFDKIVKLLLNKPEKDEACLRDDYSEVAVSDLTQGGVGFQATLFLEKDDTIGNVDLIGALEMIGRTQSPFSGTMGAHSTAWVTHLDAVRCLLIKKTIPEALKALQARAQETMQDPGLALSGQISEKHQLFLIGAFNVLGDYNKELESVLKKSVLEQTSFLEQYILGYLSFVNFLPLSTVEVGKVPGGRREGEHRNFLLNYEEYGDQVLQGVDLEKKQEILKEHLRGLFDSTALKEFPPELGAREKINFNDNLEKPFDKNHPLYDFILGKISKMEKSDAEARGKKVAFDRFLETIIEAYPRATIDSGILEPKKVEELKSKVLEKEKGQLKDMLGQNNCLIIAINRAAFGPDARVADDQLLDIRMRIGEIGTMLLATPNVIGIIRDVLHIDRGIVVNYPHPTPPEYFGNRVNPVRIRHTGYAHFEPDDGDEEEIFLSPKTKK